MSDELEDQQQDTRSSAEAADSLDALNRLKRRAAMRQAGGRSDGTKPRRSKSSRRPAAVQVDDVPPGQQVEATARAAGTKPVRAAMRREGGLIGRRRLRRESSRPVKPPVCCRCGVTLPDRGKPHRVGCRLCCTSCRPTVKKRARIESGDLLNIADQLGHNADRAEQDGRHVEAADLRTRQAKAAAKIDLLLGRPDGLTPKPGRRGSRRR